MKILKKISQSILSITYLLAHILLVSVIDTNIQKTNAVSSTIVINEIMYDPIDSDLGYEWIEVYNKSESDIDLNNWKIQIAGTTFKDSVTLSNTTQNTTIPSNSYFLICESEVLNCQYYVDKISMQNGGGTTDGVRVLDSKGYVIDTILYDSPNSNALVDDAGVPATNLQCAMVALTGQSIGRKNYIDTDDSAKDIYILKENTPGADNPLSDQLVNTGDNVLIPLGILLLFLILIYSAKLVLTNINIKMKCLGK